MPAWNWRLLLALASLLLVGSALWTSWRFSLQGHLIWDGQLWRWQSDTHEYGHELAPPLVALDWQRSVLLRCNQGRHRKVWWFWVERSAAPAQWLGLRRALYSPRRAEVFSVSTPAAERDAAISAVAALPNAARVDS